MYQIKYGSYILYDPRLTGAADRLFVRDPSVYLAVGKAGEMSFTLQADHPYLGKLRRMSGLVELLDGSTPIYRGRITKNTRDFYGAHRISTEGIMAALNDSIIPPFAFPGDFTTDTGYREAADTGNVVEYLFRWFLAQHNAQVSSEQQIKPGVCTVKDANNYIARRSGDYLTTMEAIRSRLPESALGGYLMIRYEDDGNYLDYYADLPLSNTQSVEFAKNLLDLTSEADGTKIYTAILPLGADDMTLSSLPDGDLTDDLVKSGLIVYSKSAVANYGRITRQVKWDDVTVAANLQRKAQAALVDNGLSIPETITCRAVDLGWEDSVQHFRVGRMTALASTPHGYSAYYPLMELEPDIMDPGNTQVTLGATTLTYTGSQIESTRKAADDLDYTRTDLSQRMDGLQSATEQTVQTITNIQKQVDGILLTAQSKFVERSDFSEYTDEVRTSLAVLADKINIEIEKLVTLQQDHDAYKLDVQGYIRQGIVGYDGEVPIIGIAIGRDIRIAQSGITTDQGVYDVIDKSSNMSVWTTEKLSFYIGGREVAYFSNGKLTVTSLETDRIIGAGKWNISFDNGVKFKWIGT